MSSFDVEAFTRDGYQIVLVLTDAQIARYLPVADAMMASERFSREHRFHYISLINPDTAERTLQEVIHHQVLLEAVGRILGVPLIIDNASFLAAEPGVAYRQGWHRDVLQVPQEEIGDFMFSPAWRHNNVQLNLALTPDSAFWAVPGSHLRPNTAAEQAAFGGTKHMSPVEASMPDGRCIELRPGEAVIYNNNLIHRGFRDFAVRRRTFHIGYHCGSRPPTWHFYSHNHDRFTSAYLATLSPTVRKMIEDRIRREKEYPDVKTSYRSGLVGG